MGLGEIALLVALPIVIVAIVLTIVFTLVGRRVRARTAQELAQLAEEGVILDSGVRPTTIHYEGYSEPGMYSGLRTTASAYRFVLTQKQLHVLGSRSKHVPRSELGRYSLVERDGRVVLQSDRPVGGEGHIEYRVAFEDPAKWIAALREAGVA